MERECRLFFLISFILYTGTILWFMLAYMAPLMSNNYPGRMTALLAAIATARTCTRVLFPLAAITFKWSVIGRYKPGIYPMCVHHLTQRYDDHT